MSVAKVRVIREISKNTIERRRARSKIPKRNQKKKREREREGEKVDGVKVDINAR